MQIDIETVVYVLAAISMIISFYIVFFKMK